MRAPSSGLMMNCGGIGPEKTKDCGFSAAIVAPANARTPTPVLSKIRANFCANMGSLLLRAPLLLGASTREIARASRQKKRAPRCREALVFIVAELLVRRAVAASAGAATRAIRGVALHVGQQRRLRAHDLGERAPSADFVAPHRNARRGTADADSADQLIAVDDDWQAAGIGEIAEGILAQFRNAALQDLIHDGLARRAHVQRRSRL